MPALMLVSMVQDKHDYRLDSGHTGWHCATDLLRAELVLKIQLVFMNLEMGKSVESKNTDGMHSYNNWFTLSNSLCNRLTCDPSVNIHLNGRQAHI